MHINRSSIPQNACFPGIFVATDTGVLFESVSLRKFPQLPPKKTFFLGGGGITEHTRENKTFGSAKR